MDSTRHSALKKPHGNLNRVVKLVPKLQPVGNLGENKEPLPS